MTWKPTAIPKGFALIIDTREQQPLFTAPPTGLTIVRRKLDTGDYSVDGYEDALCVERKQNSDFYGYIGKERDRTVKKLEALSKMRFAALVIEETEARLFGVQRYTKLTHEHARGFLKMVEVKYGIHTLICHNRVTLERWILDRLAYGYKILKGVS
jgi:ERCC4-type nuclease